MDTALTPAAQVIIAIIPVVGIAIGGILVFFAILWHHHEVKQRIAMGTYTPFKFNFRAFSLLTGLLLVGVGLVLTAMFALLEGMCYALLGGVVPLVLGIMLLLFFKLNPDFKQDADGKSEP